MLIKNPHWDQDPITHALNIATSFEAFTPEQKSWVIDQIVRALTRCPLVIHPITTSKGEQLEFELLGESKSYLTLLDNNPNWDKGIPT